MPLGQTIFDALSTAAGHPINRGAINAQVANSQALNAYRDAETQDAFNKARMSRDQAEAFEKEQNSIDHLSSSLTATFGDPDIARAAATSVYKTGNLQEFYKGLSEHDVQTLQDRYDNANVNDRPIILQTILAHQDPQALAQIQAGAPLNQAKVNETNSETALNQGKLAHLNDQNGAGLDPGAVNWEAYRIYKGLPMDALGMGNGGIRVAAIGQAAKMAQQAQQGGQEWSDPAFDHMIANNLGYAGTHAGVVAGARGYASGQANQNQIRLETGTGHLQYIPGLVEALHTGDFRPLSGLAAAYGINVNQPAQVVAPLLAQGLAGEIAAIYAPAGSTQQDRDALAARFAVQLMSPTAAMSLKSWAEGMVGTRLDALRQSYIDNHGYQSPQAAAADFNKGLTPITQQVYHLGTGQQLTGAGQNAPGGANNGAPAAQPGPPGGGAPPPPAASAGPAGAPPMPQPGSPEMPQLPRLTQTPPGTPGGTPAGSVPGAQAPPAGQPAAASGGPPNMAQAPIGHQQFPTMGPHGFAPPPQLLKQASDPNDPGINHLSNGEVWSWRAGDVPRYVGMMPVPTPGQGTTQTPNMPTGVIAPSNNGLNNPTQ